MCTTGDFKHCSSLRRSELESLGLHERLFLLAVARYFKENEEVYAPT